MSLKLPGFGLPLDGLSTWTRPEPKKIVENNRFPHAIADFFATAGVALREQRMLGMINLITDKPRWWEKIQDEEIVAKWRDEACGNEEQQRTSAQHLDLESFIYCMDELYEKAAYFEKHGLVHVLDADATIVKKDLPANDYFWKALKSAAFVLEDVPDRVKDWHPGTDGKVLDLLHPSMFPLQYGKSRVLADRIVSRETCCQYIGMGEICPMPEVLKSDESFEREVSWGHKSAPMKPWGSYQWLPSEVSFREGKAHIESYVNNLHPQDHPELYEVLEAAVDKAVPMWNECLSWFHERLRISPTEMGWRCYEGPTYPGYPVEEPDEGEDHDDQPDTDWDRQNHFEEWLRHNPDERVLVHPTAEKFITFEERAKAAGVHRIDVLTEFPEGLQVIFKLATVHLTPDDPTYGGSSWHVEGCLNEHIAATALFYYDSENITDNHLQFRQHIDAEQMVMMPAQYEYAAVEDAYGIADGDSAVQELGKVLTKPGRLLAFPNVLQHRVGEFELDDPTKPGHRKILAMFLIDPNIKILSTANVPPQRRDWWAREVRKVPEFAALPVELFDAIIESVEDFPISWDAACDAREILMEERGRVGDTYDEMLREDTFFFCEH